MNVGSHGERNKISLLADPACTSAACSASQQETVRSNSSSCVDNVATSACAQYTFS